MCLFKTSTLSAGTSVFITESPAKFHIGRKPISQQCVKHPRHRVAVTLMYNTALVEPGVSSAALADVTATHRGTQFSRNIKSLKHVIFCEREILRSPLNHDSIIHL